METEGIAALIPPRPRALLQSFAYFARCHGWPGTPSPCPHVWRYSGTGGRGSGPRRDHLHGRSGSAGFASPAGLIPNARAHSQCLDLPQARAVWHGPSPASLVQGDDANLTWGHSPAGPPGASVCHPKSPETPHFHARTLGSSPVLLWLPSRST